MKNNDTYSISRDAQGRPRPELFVADQLHFNAEGYRLLAEKVRPCLPKRVEFFAILLKVRHPS
jgi:lysophospholipase L1-like esterase